MRARAARKFFFGPPRVQLCSIQRFVGYLRILSDKVYILYDTVMEFFEEMLKDKETTEKLIILKNDVAYLSDIFFMLNESNK